MNRLTGKRTFYGWRLVWLGLLAIPAAVHAYTNEEHSLAVHVIDSQSGQPVRDAAVCLGTSARLDQFGSQRTGGDGIVRFRDLLPNPLVLSVSRTGYRSQRRAMEPIYESRVVVLKLARGGGGAPCQAPPRQPAPAAASGIAIQQVLVSRDDTAADTTGVILTVKVRGQANQIRIGERGDLSGSEWQDLQGPVAYTLSSAAVNRLYVQVRRKLGAEGVSIEEVSPIRQVRFTSPR